MADKGGCSYFALRVSDMAGAEHSSATTAMPLSGRRILVLEDEYFIGDDLRRVLTELGASVIGPIPDLVDGENIVSRGEPLDAALLDINLRNELIFPLARSLRQRKVPVVFTTGYDKAVLLPEFQDTPLLEKPVDMRRMARLLTELMP
jgi:DNA-binding response OmpR family regulator